MKHCYLIRHNENTANAGEISRDNQQTFLTHNVEKQTLRLSENLPFQPTHLFASELPRTQQSAQPMVEKYQLPVTIHADLNKFKPLGISTITGMNDEEHTKAYEHYWQSATPETQIGDDGEPFAKLQQRIQHFLEDINNMLTGSICFRHSIWIKTLAWQLLGFLLNTQINLIVLLAFTPPTARLSCISSDLSGQRLYF